MESQEKENEEIRRLFFATWSAAQGTQNTPSDFVTPWQSESEIIYAWMNKHIKYPSSSNTEQTSKKEQFDQRVSAFNQFAKAQVREGLISSCEEALKKAMQIEQTLDGNYRPNDYLPVQKWPRNKVKKQ